MDRMVLYSEGSLLVLFVLNTEVCCKYKLNPLLRNTDNFEIMDPLFRTKLEDCVNCVCKILSLAQIWFLDWLFGFDGRKERSRTVCS